MSKSTNDPQKNEGIPYVPNELINVEESSFISKNSQKNDVQAVSSLDGKTEADLKSLEAKTESDGSGKEKVLKKPDKILPCPRCNSMETKFCYYNNYNVNQPRHFCRNCQRYWTAGGTMRNVPVGAGRRKHKHASHYHHVMIPSDNIVSARGDVSELMHHQALPCAPAVHSPTGPAKGSETVLKFGSEVPLCESMATVLNIGEHKNTNFPSSASGDGREEQSCSSSVVVSSCIENGNPDNAVKNEPNGMSRYSNGALPPIQCFPSGPALVFPWGPGWNNVAAMASAQCLMEPVHGLENGKENQLSWAPQMVMTAPGICSPVVPFPLVPPFWSCSTGWPNGMWSAPWPGSNCGIMPSNPSSDTSSGNNSPTLGKHSREASLQGEEKNEKNLWVPKTLRIDDPDEAAKSSIWATLGIKPDEKGLFKSFQWRALKNGEASESSPVIHANPAAFSRSQSFQEST